MAPNPHPYIPCPDNIKEYLKANWKDTTISKLQHGIHDNFNLIISWGKVQSWLSEMKLYDVKDYIKVPRKPRQLAPVKKYVEEAGMPITQWLDMIESRGNLIISDETISTIKPDRFTSFLLRNNLTIAPFLEGLNIVKPVYAT